MGQVTRNPRIPSTRLPPLLVSRYQAVHILSRSYGRNICRTAALPLTMAAKPDRREDHMQTVTRLRPGQQSRRDVFQWISLGAILFSALISMARFAQAYHHRSLTWLCMVLLTGASIIFFVNAIRTPTEINKQASMICSVSAMMYSVVPFLHLRRP